MSFKYVTVEQSRQLKAKIMNAGLDIGIVAREMGISRATLSSRVNGKTDFSRSEMEHFAEILKEKPQNIFFAL